MLKPKGDRVPKEDWESFLERGAVAKVHKSVVQVLKRLAIIWKEVKEFCKKRCTVVRMLQVTEFDSFFPTHSKGGGGPEAAAQ